MNKLFKFKRWLTLKDTSEWLTYRLGSNVSETDCLQLALDGHLTISVMLNNEQYAVSSAIIKTTKRESLSHFITKKTDDGAYIQFPDSERFVANDYLDCKYDDVKREGDVLTLNYGIYDLPMLGAEVFDVMYRLDVLEGRSPREFLDLDGVLLITSQGLVNVLKPINDWSFKPDNCGKNRYYDNTYNEFVDFTCNGYYKFFCPAGGLSDFELIFRRENIEKFEKKLSCGEEQTLTLDKSLLVIGAMLHALKKAEPANKRWTQEALKAEMLEGGLKLSSRSLDEYFSSANKYFKS